MVTFPSPIEVTFASYPIQVTLEIDVSPDGMIATGDLERLPAGTFVPVPVDLGNNLANGKIIFKSVSVDKGDTLLATTRVTSLQTADQNVTVDHNLNSEPPHTLSATLATGIAEKFYAEFIFS
jgi:hypothetical protein